MTTTIIFFGHSEDRHEALPISAKGNRIRLIIDGKKPKWYNLNAGANSRTCIEVESPAYSQLINANRDLRN